jgi:hypothetical protein
MYLIKSYSTLVALVGGFLSVAEKRLGSYLGRYLGTIFGRYLPRYLPRFSIPR